MDAPREEPEVAVSFSIFIFICQRARDGLLELEPFIRAGTDTGNYFAVHTKLVFLFVQLILKIYTAWEVAELVLHRLNIASAAGRWVCFLAGSTVMGFSLMAIVFLAAN